MRILHPWFSAASAGALAFAAEITDCPAHANNLKIISGGVADDEAPFSLGGTIPSKSSSLLSSKSSSSSSCRVPVFDGPRLHEALEGQWLYMAGDSSTRGLALALYYSLLDAAATLASPPLLRSMSPGDSNSLAVRLERSARLFRYGGDESSRADCRRLFLAAGRPDSAEACDDFGDPCHDPPIHSSSSSSVITSNSVSC